MRRCFTLRTERASLLNIIIDQIFLQSELFLLAWLKKCKSGYSMVKWLLGMGVTYVHDNTVYLICVLMGLRKVELSALFKSYHDSVWMTKDSEKTTTQPQVSEKMYHKIMLSTTCQVLEYLAFLMVINTEVNINQAYPLSAKRSDEKSTKIYSRNQYSTSLF